MFNFGEWVHSQRNDQKIQVRALSALAGVDVGTISRIENNKTQPTVNTAVRICKGLEIPLNILISDLGFEKSLSYYQNIGLEDKSPRITSHQIKLFLQACIRRPDDIGQFFQQTVNNWKQSKGLQEYFSEEQLTSLDKVSELIWSPTFEFPFPPTLNKSQVLSLIHSKEVIIYPDVGAYLRSLRQEKGLTLVDLEQKIGISDSVLYRLETGLLENIKLPDLVKISDFLDHEGTFFLVSWLAGEFSAWVEREQEFKKPPVNMHLAASVYRIAFHLIKLSRWIRFWGQDYPTFIADLQNLVSEKE